MLLTKLVRIIIALEDQKSGTGDYFFNLLTKFRFTTRIYFVPPSHWKQVRKEAPSFQRGSFRTANGKLLFVKKTGKPNLGLPTAFQCCDVRSHKPVVAQNPRDFKRIVPTFYVKLEHVGETSNDTKELRSCILCSECFVHLCFDSKENC